MFTTPLGIEEKFIQNSNLLVGGEAAEVRRLNPYYIS